MLTNIGKVTIYRKKRDTQYPMNPASINSKTKKIILYDSIHQYGMERVLAHELAHILYEKLPNDTIKSYLKIADWKEYKIQGVPGMINVRKIFVASDSEDSPSEDFANNIEYYLYEEKTLKEKNPKIYKWIKKLMKRRKK